MRTCSRCHAGLLFLVSCGASPSVSEECAQPDHGPRTELLVAGSGTGLAPARLIAGMYGQQTGEKVRVAASIGSSGGIKALKDGAIDIAVVTRALHPNERHGLVQTLMAETHIVGVVSRGKTRAQHSLPELLAWYQRSTHRWADGSARVLLARQPDDTINKTLAANHPELAAAIANAIHSGQALVRYTDQNMRDALSSIPGAVGFMDAGTVALEKLPFDTIPLGGGPEHMEATVPIFWVTRPSAEPAVMKLLATTYDSEVRFALAKAGYVMAKAP